MQYEWNQLGVALTIAIIAYFLFRMFKHGGFKGAMFGARIKTTLGEAQGTGQNFGSTYVRVHELDGGNSNKRVGIELVVKSMGGFSMSPVTLSTQEARKLAQLINDAAK